MNGGSSAPHLACTPCVPLFFTLFNRGGNRRAFRLRGAGGDHFHCTVEPSPGHIRCRIKSLFLGPNQVKIWSESGRTLFSARFLAVTTSRLPSMPSFPPPLYCFHTRRIKVGNREPQEGSSNAEMSRRTKCTFKRCTFVTP